MTLSHSLQLLQTVKNINDTPISMQMEVPHIHVLHETVLALSCGRYEEVQRQGRIIYSAWFSFQYCAQLPIQQILVKMKNHCFDI